jgi:hypothetical protein
MSQQAAMAAPPPMAPPWITTTVGFGSGRHNDFGDYRLAGEEHGFNC